MLSIWLELIQSRVCLLLLMFVKLNDIISLVVGLWAVKASQKSSTDKYSFGVSIGISEARDLVNEDDSG